LLIVQPSKALEHNRRYAVAVIDAIGVDGEKLPISDHLQLLLTLDESLSVKEQKRGEFYVRKVLPALNEAAPFLLDSSNQTTLSSSSSSTTIPTSSIQLLFDFHTMSAESQLGNTKKIIKGTLEQFDKKEWNGWDQSNVRPIRVINNYCSNDNNQMTARIIHGSIDLPHFLIDTSVRISELDTHAIDTMRPNGLFTVKFIVTIPCSLALGSQPLRAVLDYGHGFLYSRNELLDGSLQRLSHENGYIMIASNWRGMSMFDLPVVVKAFAASPNILASIKDNIIQGYAFKAAIAHFCRNGLIDMDFMKLDNIPIKVQEEDKPPRYVFYGKSQGGILGSAYSTLMGPSKLLDGAALVSPAFPFSMLLSRSTLFKKYHKLMLLNLLHSRHVRIFISMMQMYYDSVEAGGILSSIKDEDRVQTLLQAGIGDPTVTTIGTEILARSYNASIFPNNPHKIYNLHTISNNETVTPRAVLSEILYEEDKDLPLKNVGVQFNPVHRCVGSDPDLFIQRATFISTGDFVNACPPQGCKKKSSWQRFNANQC
jgi:hypothetical protein